MDTFSDSVATNVQTAGAGRSASGHHDTAPARGAASRALRGLSAVVITALCLCGGVVSGILLRDDLDVFAGGIAHGLFCGGVGVFNCHAVASHESAWFLGLPVAAWGLFFYIVMTGLSMTALTLRGADQKAAISLMFLLAALAAMVDAYLAYIMIVRIKSVCLNCVATYGINIALLLLTWRRDYTTPGVVRWRYLLPSARRLFGTDLAAYYGETLKTGLLLLTLGATGFAVYTVIQPTRELVEHGEREIKWLALRMAQDEPDVDMGRFADQPSIGPLDAPVQIAAAGDFQCPYCRSIANLLEEIRAANAERVRLIFVNSPISSACNPAIGEDTHPDACWLARLATCAASSGEFWRMHRWLFDELPLSVVNRKHVSERLSAAGFDAATLLACADSETARAAVAADVALCRELGLTATPSLVINGYVKRGGYFPWMLRQIISKHMLEDGLGCEPRPYVGPPKPAGP